MLWAPTGTSSLNDASPNVNLNLAVLGSEAYGLPPPAQQKKNGPTPLAELLGGKNDTLELLAIRDVRMQQVVYADGELWSALNTVVESPNGSPRVGLLHHLTVVVDKHR